MNSLVKKVSGNSKADLTRHDPESTLGFRKDQSDAMLSKYKEKLFSLQTLLYAQNKHAVLVVLQGSDASGKDGTIRNVFSGINPQGCQVTSFKQPTTQELAQDFLWRIHKAAPAKGMIGIFNRSHYEDVLIARVRELVPRAVWSSRYEQINAFEKILHDNGTVILKFFFNISKDEQKKRFDVRLADPTKVWKFNPNDEEERKHWNDYQKAYQDAIRKCHTPWAPWYVIPANRKWVRNLAVAHILAETLEGLKMKWPKLIKSRV